MKLFGCIFLLAFGGSIFAQDLFHNGQVEASFFRTNILLHSPDLTQLITGHPDGVLLSYSVKTNGSQEWERLYNYPEYGGYFLYQDFKNPILGKNYAAGVHYNFYFLKRHLQLKVAQGIAMTTNPYDKVDNPKNSAFGSKIMANINFGLNYKKENIVENLGFQAGFIFTHFSMGRTKSPNSGINTYGLNVGLNYNLEQTKFVVDTSTVASIKKSEPIKLNIVFRGGSNESQNIGSGSKPFFHIGGYIDKRLNRKSAIQLGSELFLTTSFKEYIKFQAIAYPEESGVTATTDYKRVGVFIGHELFINRLSVETQIGYYAYRKFKFDDAVYERVGLKYYITPKIFAAFSLKTHGFLAEALEGGFGVRL